MSAPLSGRPIVRWVRRLLHDRRGGTLVEFALLAPVIIAMLLGVLHVGLQMQNSSALKSIASDTARSVAVDYQKSLLLTNEQIVGRVHSIAFNVPYSLNSNRLSATVTDVTSRIEGAQEKRLTLAYTMPSFLQVIGIGDQPMTYSRPIFLTTFSAPAP